MSELKTIAEFQAYTGMNQCMLALYQSHGLFQTERNLRDERVLDSRWFTVWQEHFSYMTAGFDKLEALFQATEAVFGADFLAKRRTERLLYGF